MATYTIVDSSTDPLGPGEILAGQTIQVSDGDVFIIGPSADAAIDFEAAGGGPANFDIVVNDSNANGLKITVGSDLTPSITIADNVDLSGITVDAVASDALTMDIGNNASLGKFDGSDTGADVITIGTGFTATADWKTTGGADSITVGDDASFVNIDTGIGSDTIVFGDGATTSDISTGAGNDTVFFGDGLVAGKIKTEDGDDTITTGLNPSFSEVDGGVGNDTYTTQTSGGTVANMESTSVVCYAPGTLIDTPDGPRPVEALRPGDAVLTVDRGPQLIRWVRSSEQPLEEVGVDDKPVLIKAGALGADLPRRDLVVSPQHRVLVGGNGQLEVFFGVEAFVPAKSLTKLPGVRYMKGKDRMTWVHFACDRHEVVIANGCQSESLLLGPTVLDGLTAPERRTVTRLFGGPALSDTALNGAPARTCLTVGQAHRRLARRTGPRKNISGHRNRGLNVDVLCARRFMADLSSPNPVGC